MTCVKGLAFVRRLLHITAGTVLGEMQPFYSENEAFIIKDNEM